MDLPPENIGVIMDYQKEDRMPNTREKIKKKERSMEKKGGKTTSAGAAKLDINATSYKDYVSKYDQGEEICKGEEICLHQGDKKVPLFSKMNQRIRHRKAQSC